MQSTQCHPFSLVYLYRRVLAYFTNRRPNEKTNMTAKYLLQKKSQTRPKHFHAMTACVIGLLLFGVLLALAACSDPGPPVDPYARFRPAMRAEFQSDLDELGLVPVYNIEISVDDAQNVLTGTAHIDVPNVSPHLWDHLIFRLYPMLPHFGGTMAIQKVLVDDQITSFVYQPGTGKSALRVSLPDRLRPSQSAQVFLEWKLEIPTWSNSSEVYALFGSSQEMTSLPLFYPALAVYQPDAKFGRGEWWVDSGTVRGDSAFNYTSLFVVTATLPSNQIPVASGTLVTSTLVDNHQSRHVWVTGPSREFLLHMSPQLASTFTQTYGTRVTSYWLPGQEVNGRAALEYAVASLRIYTDLYGPYPYRDMRVAPAPLSYRGMEYPGVNLIGVEAYGRFQATLESLVAHEVAHQWWYQIVHNDPVNMPWLDEALAEYSIKRYVESVYGEKPANNLQSSRWESRVNQVSDPALALNQTVESFSSTPIYEAVVYSKGALFYDEMRKILGDRRFDRFLNNYFRTHRYQIVDTAEWISVTNQIGNEAVNTLWQEWVQTPEDRAALEKAEGESQNSN